MCTLFIRKTFFHITIHKGTVKSPKSILIFLLFLKQVHIFQAKGHLLEDKGETLRHIGVAFVTLHGSYPLFEKIKKIFWTFFPLRFKK